MPYDDLNRAARRDAAGTREDLAALGVYTTVSQIALHERALSAWRSGRMTLLSLRRDWLGHHPAAAHLPR